jgi:spore photoproduct lyase
MKLFTPERVIFEPSSLEYPLGRKLYDYFQNCDIEIIKASRRNVSRAIPGTTASSKYAHSKKTLVMTTMKGTKLDTCKPSADFEFSLISNCPGNCEYCYLQTTQGSKPYIKVFVNLEDIFNIIKQHIINSTVNNTADDTPDSTIKNPTNGITNNTINNTVSNSTNGITSNAINSTKNNSNIVTFEVASLGDPLALEHLTGSLAKTIEFFGNLENARLRVVTKFNNIDSMLWLKHNGHTRFRISLNSKYVIDNFEHNTANLDERIEAALKLSRADYPIGFIIATIMVYENWKEGYIELFDKLKQKLGHESVKQNLTFELIQHRFTATAKKMIVERFPRTRLDMDETHRTLKWGRYGRFKYVYPKELANEIKSFISSLINERFPDAIIEYFT